MNSIALDFVPDNMNVEKVSNNNLETITLGGGCYWCVEAVYEKLDGVKSVVSGFAGEKMQIPLMKKFARVEPVTPKWCKLLTTKPKLILMKYFRCFLPFTIQQP
jgi:peptide methionine sulfoxide reductase MsrA